MTPMLCQACENNETTVSVICDSCVSHYASIREGQYQEQELVAGEARYVVRSWVQVNAPAHKKASRDDKAGKKKGFFGKKEAPVPAAEAEEVPPPDWKNRVFPLPDPVAPVAAAAYTAPTQGDFSYGAHEPAPPAADEPPATQTPDETPSIALDIETPAIDLSKAAPEGEATVFEFAAAPEAIAPIAPEETTLQAVVAEPAAPAEPEATVSPSLGSFFESLNQPSAMPEPSEPAPEVVAEPQPASELTHFFESLGQAAPPEPAAPAEAAPTSPDLSSFFASLSATPALPETAPTAAPEPEVAPASANLAGFFESLEAPVEQPEPLPTQEEPPSDIVLTGVEPLSAQPAEPVFDSTPAAPAPAGGSSADLSNFFESLSQPAASFEPPTMPEAAQAAPEPFAAPEPIALPTASSPDLSTFFDSLSAAAPQFHVPPAFEAPAPADAATPFSFELDLPTSPGAAAPGAPRPTAADLKPPTIGSPFTIDLTPPAAPVPPVRATSESIELKRKLSSTGGLSFTDDEDGEPAHDGLLSGLTYSGGVQKGGGLEIALDDDDDDEDDSRTIDL